MLVPKMASKEKNLPEEINSYCAFELDRLGVHFYQMVGRHFRRIGIVGRIHIKKRNG